MDQEIASVINSTHFHQQAPAHIVIMNARRLAKGEITAIAHLNSTAKMIRRYHDMIITAARTVVKGVVDVEENESSERLKIHEVPHIQYMGKGMEGLQMMQEEFEAENEGIQIPTTVWRLGNLHTMMEWRLHRDIVASSVVCVVKGSNTAQRWSRSASRWLEGGTESKHKRMWALRAGVSSAIDGVTSRTRAAWSPHVATGQVITRQATRSAMWWDPRWSRDHSVVICWRTDPTAMEIIFRSATDMQRRQKPPERCSRVGW